LRMRNRSKKNFGPREWGLLACMTYFFLIHTAGIPDLWARTPQKKPNQSSSPSSPPQKQIPTVSIFGVQIEGPISEAHGLQQAVSAGAHWVRFDAFDWDRIEPLPTSPTTYHWEAVDETSLLNAARNGLEIIAVVKYLPSWAQKYPGSACGPIHSEALSRFAKFLSSLVHRYKNPPFNIKFWELGNEPDAPVWPGRSPFGCWGEKDDPYFGGEYYAKMLKAAYPAIKAADPKARVLLGGLLLDNPNETVNNTARFLEGILKGGGGPFFDLISFHGYSYPYGTEGRMGNPNWPGSGTSVTEKVIFIKKILNRYGFQSKPLLNTEAALYCDAESPQCLETQSMFIPRAYAEGIAAGLQGIVYYSLVCDFRTLGLLRTDLSPRPSFLAYQTAASFLAQARYRVLPAGYPVGITAYSFVPPTGGEFDLIWSNDGDGQTVTLTPGSTAYDRYGSLINPEDGKITVGYGPVYIQRP
jgi:hypothetical protein